MVALKAYVIQDQAKCLDRIYEVIIILTIQTSVSAFSTFGVTISIKCKLNSECYSLFLPLYFLRNLINK